MDVGNYPRQVNTQRKKKKGMTRRNETPRSLKGSENNPRPSGELGPLILRLTSGEVTRGVPRPLRRQARHYLVSVNTRDNAPLGGGGKGFGVGWGGGCDLICSLLLWGVLRGVSRVIRYSLQVMIMEMLRSVSGCVFSGGGGYFMT